MRSISPQISPDLINPSLLHHLLRAPLAPIRPPQPGVIVVHLHPLLATHPGHVLISMLALGSLHMGVVSLKLNTVLTLMS